MTFEDKPYEGPTVNYEAEKLREYLNKKNPELSEYADQIVALPRWKEVIGIIGKETSFCLKGVGASRNNCGAIMSRSGGFKRYTTKLEAIEDVSILLQKPLYAGYSIEEINGTYCVDETQVGNRCIGWDEQIMKFIKDLE